MTTKTTTTNNSAMTNFWCTDDWTPSMFQAFMCYCWSNSYTPTPATAKDWAKKNQTTN